MNGQTVKSIRIAVLLALLALATGCTTSPTGRNQLVLFSPAAMRDMGEAVFADIKAGTPAASASATRYVQCVTDALVAVLPDGEPQDWEVEVFDEDTVNAFALPGGKIGVFRGLLDVAGTADQLAAVIGHEMGHVLARHGNERMSSQFVVGASLSLTEALTRAPESPESQRFMAALGVGAQVGILLPYSRSHESEADRIGLELMARAGFDPEESVTLWRNMSRVGGARPIEFLSTHPGPETRIQALQAHMPAAMALYREARAAGRAPACDG